MNCCVICLEVKWGCKMFQCFSGHLACEDCHGRLNEARCPTCNGRMPRNRVVERFIK